MNGARHHVLKADLLFHDTLFPYIVLLEKILDVGILPHGALQLRIAGNKGKISKVVQVCSLM